MKRVEKHIILKSASDWDVIDDLAFKAKNLYNKANYVVRQTFFETSKLVEHGLKDHADWVRYQSLDKLAKEEKWDEYRELPAATSQQTLRLLDKNWTSFFKSIKEYRTNGCLGKPKPPKYKHKADGRSVLVFTGQQVKVKDGYIHFPKMCNLNPVKTKQAEIQQVRIVPRAACYVLEVIYEKDTIHVANLDSTLYVGIDLGIDNLATITSNKDGLNPVIVNGRPLKSINQYYNKRRAEFQSYIGNKGHSNKLNALLNKRSHLVENYLHHTSKFIINHCIENNIGNIVIGNNEGWKQNINMGKRNNQKFASIPFSTLIHQIQYKAEEVGIQVNLTEESYTSKASFLDMDEIPVYGNEHHREFSGKRVKRGLYLSKSGRLINADVNGSLNIIRKVIPNAFANGIEAVGLWPVRVSV